MANVNFLCDIMSHLNHLNLQLQGNINTVADMYKAVESFRLKLSHLEQDIQERKLHFPHLQKHCVENGMQENSAIKDFVTSLEENSREWFENLPKLSSDILLFLRLPISASADGQCTAEARRLLPSIDEPSLQMEIVEMGTCDLLKAQHKDSEVTDFWIKVVPQAQLKNMRAIALTLLTMFPSTYVCESSFSSMNSVQNQTRNRLSGAHLASGLPQQSTGQTSEMLLHPIVVTFLTNG